VTVASGIETDTLRDVQKDGPVGIEGYALLLEQKRPQVRERAESVGVDLLNEPYPGPFDQVPD
jgi:hypothetical protein